MKQRWPLEDASRFALQLLEQLRPVCERIVIAGSIRRKRPSIGDIEILYVPWIKLVPDLNDLLKTPQRTNLTDWEIARLEKDGVLSRRKNVNGYEVFGQKNKLMLHVASGIPVDLFATTRECWFNTLVVRTGPAELNIRVASEAKNLGWKWNVYGPGFTTDRSDRMDFPVTCEEDVFRLVGLPYLPPEERR